MEERMDGRTVIWKFHVWTPVSYRISSPMDRRTLEQCDYKCMNTHKSMHRKAKKGTYNCVLKCAYCRWHLMLVCFYHCQLYYYFDSYHQNLEISFIDIGWFRQLIGIMKTKEWRRQFAPISYSGSKELWPVEGWRQRRLKVKWSCFVSPEKKIKGGWKWKRIPVALLKCSKIEV